MQVFCQPVPFTFFCVQHGLYQFYLLFLLQFNDLLPSQFFLAFIVKKDKEHQDKKKQAGTGQQPAVKPVVFEGQQGMCFFCTEEGNLFLLFGSLVFDFQFVDVRLYPGLTCTVKE
ncbi:hypothetical protein D3C86_1499570 [compost metagenome]